MLATFVEFLNENGYKILRQTKDIFRSCCKNSNIEGISFDEVKSKFCQNHNIGSPLKSVDVIIFKENENEIFFVEMTSFNDYKQRTGKSFPEFKEQHFLQSFELINKIAHSIYIILGIIHNYDTENRFFNYFLDRSKIKFKPIMLSDVSDQELNAEILARLGTQQIGIFPTPNPQSIIGEVLLMNCEKFNSMFATF